MNFDKESEDFFLIFFSRGRGGGGGGGGEVPIYILCILQNSLRSQSGQLNIDPKQYAKYQNPSLSSSQDIMLTRFFYCYNFRVVKGA